MLYRRPKKCRRVARMYRGRFEIWKTNFWLVNFVDSVAGNSMGVEERRLQDSKTRWSLCAGRGKSVKRRVADILA
jgi:hypothetical protein